MLGEGVAFSSLIKCVTGKKANIIKLLPFLAWPNDLVWCDVVIWVTGAAAIQYSLQRRWILYKGPPKVPYYIASQQFFERLHRVTRTLNPYMAWCPKNGQLEITAWLFLSSISRKEKFELLTWATSTLSLMFSGFEDTYMPVPLCLKPYATTALWKQYVF